MNTKSMGQGLVHDVSPPKTIAGACIAVAAILSLANPAYAGESKAEKTGLEGKVELYSFKEYLDGVNASDNPGMKVEGKWKLGEGLYAGGGITQSFSDTGEGKTEFGDTRYIKGGWQGEVADLGIHAWGSLADTAVGDFGDANFGKATVEISKGDFTATGYLSTIESNKKGKKGTSSSETKWTDGWGAGASYHLNDNFDIGVMTGKEAKSQMQFSEIIAGVKYEIAKNLYIQGHLEYQLQGSEAWNIEPRVVLTYKMKPKSKDKKYKS